MPFTFFLDKRSNKKIKPAMKKGLKLYPHPQQNELALRLTLGINFGWLKQRFAFLLCCDKVS
jgi:hypothetical protein